MIAGAERTVISNPERHLSGINFFLPAPYADDDIPPLRLASFSTIASIAISSSCKYHYR